MIITSKLNMDLLHPGTIPIVPAAQTDCYCRNLEIALFNDRKPLLLEKDCRVIVRYRKLDGKGGEYDTLPNGTPAWSVHGNVLTVALAPQTLTMPGSVMMTVTVLSDGAQVSALPIQLQVEPVYNTAIAKSQDYFYVLTPLPAPASAKVGQHIRVSAVNKDGKVTEVVAVHPASGSGAGVDPEEVQQYVEEYLAENPPAPGEKGEKGDPGEKGEKGDPGIQGIPGEPGAKGEKGEPGEKGADGTGVTILGSYESETALKAAHPEGTAGDAYLIGGNLYVWSQTANAWENVGNIQGPKGEKGDKGSDGAPGAKGEKGDKGDPGADGADGKNGTSATHSWNGTVLTVTSASGTSSADLKGEKGADGAKGEKGDKGDPGTDGAQGIPGEKGEKGDKGDPGADGADGKNGTSATHSWNGTVLTVTSASGTSSADLKGEKGADGAKGDKGDKGDPGTDGAQGIPGEKGEKGDKGDPGEAGATPVKGTDYFTPEEQDAMVQEVIDQLGLKIIGEVDEANSILITADLPAGTYSIGYENADGTVTEIGTFTVGGASYTNLADPASADWLTNQRINSSKNIVDVAESVRGDKTVVTTNFLPLTGVSKYHVKGLDILSNLVNGSSTQNYGRYHMYTSGKVLQIYQYQPSSSDLSSYFTTADYDSSVTVIDAAGLKTRAGYADLAFVRLGGILTGAAEDVIITADQKIQ